VNASVPTRGVTAAGSLLIAFPSWALSVDPTLRSNAWATISARETPILLGIFWGRLQHSLERLVVLERGATFRSAPQRTLRMSSNAFDGP
jgi:hypothetical protein